MGDGTTVGNKVVIVQVKGFVGYDFTVQIVDHFVVSSVKQVLSVVPVMAEVLSRDLVENFF